MTDRPAQPPVTPRDTPFPDVDDLDPDMAYRALAADPRAVLVDVRTRAEWSFVGLPEISATGRPLWLVEWVSFPAMAPNPDFVARIAELVGADESEPAHALFICRSGGRSMMAAQAVSAAFAREGRPLRCSNVAEGFEGDLDEEGRRGRRNGWKARGLPWRQS